MLMFINVCKRIGKNEYQQVEALLMSTDKLCFYGTDEKNILQLSSKTPGLVYL